ncbi:MAG: sigma 54-interacting transcriptional regulator [Planctomycetaceae bacterium]
MNYALILLNGPTPGAGLTLDPKGDEITIGREAGRTLPIDDQLCSRLHARIWFNGTEWKLTDCNSRNGTFVNSHRVHQVTLRVGDLIRVGDRLMVFRRERDSADAVGEPVRLESSTCVVRVTEPEKRRPFSTRLSEGSPAAIRAAPILCRLSEQLHTQSSRDDLIRLTIEALKEGIRPNSIAVWLVGVDGRLTRAGGTPLGTGDDVPVLASLAVENNEAMLVQHGPRDATASTTADGDAGMVIGVPLPGRRGRRGAIECLRRAHQGPFTQDDLDLAIAIACNAGVALQNVEYREQLEQANQQLWLTVNHQHRIVGRSPAIRQLLDTVARVAPVNSTVLLRGESGTGKELIARSIHEASPRSAGPYVTVNCAAFNDTLLESELFGHEKGAFTGADQRRSGQFERAHRGTLFLDEIAEMSPACQARVLRILEGHAFERVGGNDSVRVDVRVVAATHRSLRQLVKEGRFREDLYFRLRVIEVSIPPLRERREDVLALAVHFLEQFRSQTGRGPLRLSESARLAITDYHWPGNVRELKNAIERAVVLGMGDEVRVADLAIPNADSATIPASHLMSLAEAELRHILNVLDMVEGNKSKACKILGIGRGTLYKKLEESAALHAIRT